MKRLLSVLLVSMALPVAAQDYPNKIVKIIVPFPAGGSTDILARIFDAGFSGAGETPGLGLAVCNRLMIQHGGEILVMSHINQGSTFELEFPLL